MSITPDASKHLSRDLLDDAAMFPPGNAAPMATLVEHLAWRAGERADLIGPLLVRADRWAELAAAVDTVGRPLDAVVIGDVHQPDPAHPLITVVGFESTWNGGAVPAAPGRLALEPAERADVEDLLALVGEARIEGRPVVAKFRTGGTEASAFPSEADVAFWVLAAFNAGVPFKLTAGLHHAVRHTDPLTGFEHHGFLNVMAAVLRCTAGGSLDDAAAALAQRDAGVLADEAARWSVDDALAVRSLFLSFGCCGVGEPIDDLVGLGLLPAGAA